MYASSHEWRCKTYRGVRFFPEGPWVKLVS